jgi:hypothetical protein
MSWVRIRRPGVGKEESSLTPPLFFTFGAEDGTQGLAHAQQALYRCLAPFLGTGG